METASPPLIPGSAAQGTGPPLRPQGCCASLTRRPFGPALTPEPLRTLGQAARAGHACPTRRAPPRQHHYIGTLHASRRLPLLSDGRTLGGLAGGPTLAAYSAQ